MTELNISGATPDSNTAGTDSPLSSKEGRTKRTSSSQDGLLSRAATADIKKTVGELGAVLRDLAKVQRQELKNETQRLTQERRLNEREQRMARNRQDRTQRAFDRDYSAAYREQDRRDYGALRYNADFDNRMWDRANPKPEATVAPSFGKSHRQWAGSAAYQMAGRVGLSDGAARFGGSAFGRMAAYSADTMGVGGLLETAGALAGVDAVALPGGPATEIPALLATAGIAGAIGTYQLQGKIANTAGSLISSAQPYTDLMTFGANAGRAGNYDGSSLIPALFGDSSKRDRALSQYGIGPNEVYSIMGAYGDRGSSAADILGIAKAAGEANQSNYLGGMGVNQYGSMLGFGKTMALGSSTDQLSKWQSVMEEAVAQGLDRSQTASTLESMVQGRADSGSANVSLGDSAGLWDKFAQSGLAGGRDGSLAQSYQQGLTSAWSGAGFGGDMMHTQAAESLAQQGGVPKTMADLGKRFGFDPSKLYGAGLTEANQALAALKSGDYIGFASAIQPLMSSTAQQQGDQSLVQQWGFKPGSIEYTAALANLEGANYSTETGALGSNSLPPPVGLSRGTTMPANINAALLAAAKKEGVDPNQLLALAGNETTWGTRIKTSSAGALGLLQVMPKTLEGLQKQGLFKGVTPADLKNNPGLNAEVGATIWKQDLASANGDPRLAAEMYNGGPNLGRLSPKALAGVQQYGNQFQSNYNLLTGVNNLSDLNTILSRQEQLNLAPAYSAFKASQLLLTGTPGAAIEGGDDLASSVLGGAADLIQTGASTFSDGVSHFATAVDKFVNSHGFGPKPNSGRGLTRPKLPNGTSLMPAAPQVPTFREQGYQGYRK